MPQQSIASAFPHDTLEAERPRTAKRETRRFQIAQLQNPCMILKIHQSEYGITRGTFSHAERAGTENVPILGRSRPSRRQVLASGFGFKFVFHQEPNKEPCEPPNRSVHTESCYEPPPVHQKFGSWQTEQNGTVATLLKSLGALALRVRAVAWAAQTMSEPPHGNMTDSARSPRSHPDPGCQS